MQAEPSFICQCGWRFFGDVKSLCPRCNAVTPIKSPRWVRVVQRMSQPSDIGLGATVKRIAAMIGGELFKRWSTRLGIPCGCSDREQEWNRLYPNPDYRSE